MKLTLKSCLMGAAMLTSTTSARPVEPALSSKEYGLASLPTLEVLGQHLPTSATVDLPAGFPAPDPTITAFTMAPIPHATYILGMWGTGKILDPDDDEGYKSD